MSSLYFPPPIVRKVFPIIIVVSDKEENYLIRCSVPAGRFVWFAYYMFGYLNINVRFLFNVEEFYTLILVFPLYNRLNYILKSAIYFSGHTVTVHIKKSRVRQGKDYQIGDCNYSENCMIDFDSHQLFCFGFRVQD